MVCGKTGNTATMTSTPAGNRHHIQWCCEAGRLFLLWVILCGYDSRVTLMKQALASQKAQQGRRSAASLKPGKGTGYGGVPFCGDMFLSHPVSSKFRNNEPPKPASHTAKAQEQLDQYNRIVFACLAEILDDDKSPGFPSFMRLSSRVLSQMFLSSQLLQTVAELLRNDSLTDVVKRKALYQDLWLFLKALGKHSKFREILAKERQVLKPGSDLLTVSFSRGKIEDHTTDTALSIIASLQPLKIQSETMLTRAQKDKQALGDGEDTKVSVLPEGSYMLPY
jgi:hypothetical protein